MTLVFVGYDDVLGARIAERKGWIKGQGVCPHCGQAYHYEVHPDIRRRNNNFSTYDEWKPGFPYFVYNTTPGVYFVFEIQLISGEIVDAIPESGNAWEETGWVNISTKQTIQRSRVVSWRMKPEKGEENAS